MAKQKGLHSSDKNQYIAYKSQNRLLKNRMRKIIRHATKFPNDLIATVALKRMESDGVTYRRKKPQEHGFPPQKKIKRIEYAYGYTPKSIREQLMT